MSSRHANSLQVEIVNGTSSSRLRFFHLSGCGSGQRTCLRTLTPPSVQNVKVSPSSSSFVHYFENGTNEFIDVEYKEEMKNQVEVGNDPGSSRRRSVVNKATYKPTDVRIDTDILFYHRRISVVDSEAAPSSAEASSRKKFELRTEPREVRNETGWIVYLVMTLYAFMKYAIIGITYHVFSGLRYVFSSGVFSGLKYVISELILAFLPATATSETPVEGTDAGSDRRVPAAV